MLTLGDRTTARVRFDGRKDAAAPLPLLGALRAPAVRVGLPVGAENSVTSCDLQILVYEAAEAVSS
jgi:hypothetical protein